MRKINEKMFSLVYIVVLLSLSTITYGQTVDSDNDGVADKSDLCANTPFGTNVNIYGCPLDKVSCDYQSSSISLLSGMMPIGKQTKYVLADASDGNIVQVSDIPTFTNLSGSKTYMALSVSYEDNGTIVNLQVNKQLNQVTASCFDLSDALPIKVCVTPPPSNTCDFTTNVIKFNSAIKPTGVTTKYVITTESNSIIGISDITQFSLESLSGTNSYNIYSVAYQGNANSLTLGKKISEVNATCLDWSNPLPIKVCICTPVCVPIKVIKSKNI